MNFAAIHSKPSDLAGKSVKVKDQIKDIGGQEILIEDWWDRVYGQSWRDSDGNPAAMLYAIRTGTQDFLVPADDRVLYGKVGGLGHLVHINELEVDDVD